MRRFLSLTLCCAVTLACGTPTEPTKSSSSLAIGKWAGPQVDVTVSGRSFEFLSSACVSGHFPLPTIHDDGSFSAEGELEPMAGPPPPPPWPHGRISGKVVRNTLVFSATYDNGNVIGPLTATFGAQSRSFPCPV